MIKYLFFDLGSTLIDETDCERDRDRRTLAQPGAPDAAAFASFLSAAGVRHAAAYHRALAHFGLASAPWDYQYEKLYPGVPGLLERLSRKYALAVIANQQLGTEGRLARHGIRDYFRFVVSSAEEGVAKPDPKIFELALQRAGVRAPEAYMIGDRMDNDIIPAKRLGFGTVLVLQDNTDGGCGEVRPDLAVSRIADLEKYL